MDIEGVYYSVVHGINGNQEDQKQAVGAVKTRMIQIKGNCEDIREVAVEHEKDRDASETKEMKSRDRSSGYLHLSTSSFLFELHKEDL